MERSERIDSASTSPPPRMSIWGVGPRILGPAILWGAASLAITYWRPSQFGFGVSYGFVAVAGIFLGLLALPLFVWTTATLARARRRGELATGGPYAVCRNPLYAVWIFGWLPMIGLLCNSWLFLTCSAVVYVLARRYVPREEQYLQQRFGQEYSEYKKRTSAIVPTFFRPQRSE